MSEAARQVGCAASTVTKAAQRDPEFAEQLRDAYFEQGLSPLARFRVQSQRSWRASAWFLEHVGPKRFGRRRQQVVALDEVKRLFSTFNEELTKALSQTRKDD
jgi:hypothetical protein